ncbi:MAG: hypothetical protein QF915_02435 [Candidatus Woesearchaeota archaeon]|jgi:hypothetical protein|nr:hypothetical protein [Candidatus Woesearchaeota archaeon]
MARLNKSELNKLPPAQRLKKLKEIEEEDKEELQETEELIKKVEKELKEPPVEIEAPPIEPVDISKLFEKESNLEGSVEKSTPEQETDVKYNPSDSDYKSQDVKPEGPIVKADDSTTYTPTHEESDSGTATRETIKKIKKYSKG